MMHADLLNHSDDWLKFAVWLRLCRKPGENLAAQRELAPADRRIRGFLRNVSDFHSRPITGH